MTTKQKLKISYTPLDAVSQWEGNANVGDTEAINDSVEEFDFVDPLLVQKSSGRIIAGNHRHMVAQQRGMTELPVIYLDLDDEKALRLHLAHNRTGELSSWDDADLLAQLQELGGNYAGTGFSEADLDSLQATLDGLGDDDDDLQNTLDEADQSAWPVIRVQVDNATYTEFEELPGDTPEAKFHHLLRQVR